MESGSDNADEPQPADVQISLSMAQVGVRNYFAAEHLWAARLMAQRCSEREDRLVADGANQLVDYEVRSYALTAITESVAMLEALVNEVWQDAADADSKSGGYRHEGLTSAAVNLLRKLKAEGVDRGLSVPEKYAVTLACVGASPLDKTRSPYPDVMVLIRLRNAFVHFHPKMHWTAELDAIQKRMEHLVPSNPLMRGTSHWFPHQPLCAGVARWAWKSSTAFADQWHTGMGLKHSYGMGTIDWPDDFS